MYINTLTNCGLKAQHFIPDITLNIATGIAIVGSTVADLPEGVVWLLGISLAALNFARAWQALRQKRK